MSYAPSFEEIPANTLRLYLNFSQPMGRGQVQEKITLIHDQNGEVENPFLNLGIELWDNEQRRLTLLFDPGRIKQTVGPNVQAGAPLVVGESYHLLIDGNMTSAQGQTLGENTIIPYRVIPAETRKISTDDWDIAYPFQNTTASLQIEFDRLIDTVAAMRLINILDSQKKPVSGNIKSDGRTWSFMPDEPWSIGQYQIIVHPDLEDVSGNNLRAPFDAPAGTRGKTIKAVTLSFEIK